VIAFVLWLLDFADHVVRLMRAAWSPRWGVRWWIQRPLMFIGAPLYALVMRPIHGSEWRGTGSGWVRRVFWDKDTNIRWFIPLVADSESGWSTTYRTRAGIAVEALAPAWKLARDVGAVWALWRVIGGAP
jgi:hypothetical protein